VNARHAPLLARMLLWRLTLPLARRVVPTQRLVRLLASRRGRQSSPESADAAVRIAARLWRSSEGPCLERSLALYRELGRLGSRPELVLGIGQGDERLVGHAWVEVDQRPVLGSDGQGRYPAVVRFDSQGLRS
jgi:transglutaminase superfamily protein